MPTALQGAASPQPSSCYLPPPTWVQLLWHSIDWTLWRIRCALSAPQNSCSMAHPALPALLLLSLISSCLSRSRSCSHSRNTRSLSWHPRVSQSIPEHPRAAPGQHSCMQCLCKFIYAKETQSSPGFGCNLLTTRVTAPRQSDTHHAVLHADELLTHSLPAFLLLLLTD